jgi:hypothetical protein
MKNTFKPIGLIIWLDINSYFRRIHRLNKKTLGLILLGVLAIIVIASSILNGNSENALSNKNNEHEIDNSEPEEDIIFEHIDPESKLPYGEDGIEIKRRVELDFETEYTRNYFRVSFENTGDNEVTVNIQGTRNPKQNYDLDVPAGEDNDVCFGNVSPDHYFLDITGYRGGQCKGTVNVEIRNTPFE